MELHLLLFFLFFLSQFELRSCTHVQRNKIYGIAINSSTTPEFKLNIYNIETAQTTEVAIIYQYIPKAPSSIDHSNSIYYTAVQSPDDPETSIIGIDLSSGQVLDATCCGFTFVDGPALSVDQYFGGVIGFGKADSGDWKLFIWDPSSLFFPMTIVRTYKSDQFSTLTNGGTVSTFDWKLRVFCVRFNSNDTSDGEVVGFSILDGEPLFRIAAPGTYSWSSLSYDGVSELVYGLNSSNNIVQNITTLDTWTYDTSFVETVENIGGQIFEPQVATLDSRGRSLYTTAFVTRGENLEVLAQINLQSGKIFNYPTIRGTNPVSIQYLPKWPKSQNLDKEKWS